MIRDSLYNKTIHILKEAYEREDLIQGDCASCAVATLIRESLGIKFDRYKHEYKYPDGEMFNTDAWYDYLSCGEASLKEIVIPQIESTGYSFSELNRIEDAFEAGENEREGLLNVVLYLNTLHEVEPWANTSWLNP